jgi:dethiobiotin synthetase
MQEAMTCLFVTGTDTGCGKTVVTAALVRHLRAHGTDVGVMKPFATGVCAADISQEDDIALLRAAAGIDDGYDRISPSRFTRPLAPACASEIEKRDVEIGPVLELIRDYRKAHTVTVIEGIGGVAVPLTPSFLVSDFVRDLGAPALIVARSALGTINHTLLTVEHLRGRGVPVVGVVFVRHAPGPLTEAEETGPPMAARIAGIRSFGIVPFCQGLEPTLPLARRLDALPSECEAIASLANTLSRQG